MKYKFLFTFLLFSFAAHGQIITTVAGSNDTALGDGGLAVDAGLDGPIGVALDGSGNFYIADTYHDRIRKVNAAGIITTIAGNDTTSYNGDNIPATNAHLLIPADIICDQHGCLYFSDAYHNRVRKIDTNGIITTIAGNGTGGYNGDNILADSAEVYDPHAIAFDAYGNLYISDWGNHRIRMVNSSGIITTIAGTGIVGYTGDTGPATAAEINTPDGIVLDTAGDIYFSDAGANVVRKIDVSGIITTFAGDSTATALGDNGPADSARLSGPGALAIDGSNNIYISDVGHNRIRRVDAVSGIITTIAGVGISGFSGDSGPALDAEFNEPGAVTISPAGDFYISDFGNNRIRYIKNTTAVNNIDKIENALNVYPNPNNGGFTVYIHTDNKEQIEIIITNTLGEKVVQKTVITDAPIYLQTDIPPGIYFLFATGKYGVLNKIINIVK
jgi:sugar lactone lactonase YvrE